MADAEQTKLRKRLEALLKAPENQICADCKKKGPRWASANLGTFFCIDCSGIHRNLGVHISFVRSVNLDTWTVAQVEKMEAIGNSVANAYYEANIPSRYVMPKDGDPVRAWERFIRDKYEHKKFIVPGSTFVIPDKKQSSESASSKSSGDVSTKAGLGIKLSAAPTAVKVAEAPSLLDFMDVSAPQQAAATSSLPTSSAQSLDGFGDFSTGGFAGSSATTTGDVFGGFSTAHSQPAASVVSQVDMFSAFSPPSALPVQDSSHTQASAPKPQIDIMALYNAPPVPPASAYGMSHGQMYGQQQLPPQQYQQQQLPPQQYQQQPPQQYQQLPPQQYQQYGGSLYSSQQQQPHAYAQQGQGGPMMHQQYQQQMHFLPQQAQPPRGLAPSGYPPVPSVPPPYMTQQSSAANPFDAAYAAPQTTNQQQTATQPSMGIDPFASFKVL